MLSSISGLHFAGHWNKGVPPPPPITSLRYSLQNGSGPFVNPSTGHTYLENIDRVENDGGGDLYWVGGSTLPTANTTTSPYNVVNAYRSTPGIGLSPGSLVLRPDKDNVVNVWMNLQVYPSPRDQFFSFNDAFNSSGYSFYIEGDGSFVPLATVNGINNVGTASSQTLPLNQWKMITVYFRNSNGSSVKIYIDGVLTDAGNFQNGNMNNLSKMSLSLFMSSLNSIPAARWNDFRMYLDDGVTPAQIYAAEKNYYLGGFSGGIDFTGIGKQGVFLQTGPAGASIQSGFTVTGTLAHYSFTGTSGTTISNGQVDVTPPYFTLPPASQSITVTHQVPVNGTEIANFSVWINPVGTVPGGTLMRIQYAADMIITLSMTSTRQLTGTVVKGGFTRNLDSGARLIPLNRWSMVSISVILSNSEPCFLSIDNQWLAGGGATGQAIFDYFNGTTTVTMMNSTNLRFNQVLMYRQSAFSVPAMYEASKSSYGRL